MLFARRTLGQGVAAFRLPDERPAVARQLEEVFAEFYPFDHGGAFPPHINDALLRRDILAIALFRDLRDAIQEQMRNGDLAIVIDEIHLRSCAPAERNAFLYALGLALGYPTPSQQRNPTLLWSVKGKSLPPGQLSTYSDHTSEADLHSDASYFPAPEPWLLMYSVCAARCGGGVSRFATRDSIVSALSTTASGRSASEVLSVREVPFQFYDPYFSDEPALVGGADSRVVLARVFGDSGTIRYRRDVIEHGCRTRPEAADSDTLDALRELADCIDRRVQVVTHTLCDDSVVIVDNHRVVHGRTTFADRERHLLRMRLAAEPIADAATSQRAAAGMRAQR